MFRPRSRSSRRKATGEDSSRVGKKSAHFKDSPAQHLPTPRCFAVAGLHPFRLEPQGGNPLQLLSVRSERGKLRFYLSGTMVALPECEAPFCRRLLQRNVKSKPRAQTASIGKGAADGSLPHQWRGNKLTEPGSGCALPGNREEKCSDERNRRLYWPGRHGLGDGDQPFQGWLRTA